MVFHQKMLAVLSLFVPIWAGAITLDEALSGFTSCDFKSFYYDDFREQTSHGYFLERGLKPYKAKDGLFYFHLTDRLFGLPVSEIVAPGTWDLHMVKFDVSLKDARRTFRSKFKTEFRQSKRSDNGDIPALVKDPDDLKKSVFYCNEREEGL